MEDALGNQARTRYNALGLPTHCVRGTNDRTVVTDANGAVTRYGYDGLNRLTSVHYVSDSITVTYRYDALGHRTAMTVHSAGATGCCANALGTTRYVYDDLYRLVSVTSPLTSTVSYTYDLAGNRTHLVYPDGKVVSYILRQAQDRPTMPITGWFRSKTGTAG